MSRRTGEDNSALYTRAVEDVTTRSPDCTVCEPEVRPSMSPPRRSGFWSQTRFTDKVAFFQAGRLLKAAHQTVWCPAFQHVRPTLTPKSNSPVQDGLPAAVQVVKLLLGHRVVDVHGGHTQLPGFGQLVQPAGEEGGWGGRRCGNA